MNDPNLSKRQRQSLVLNVDPVIATCQILATLSPSAISDDTVSEVIAHLTKQNQALTNAPEAEITSSLVRQSVLVEALWHHFAARAATEARPDHAVAMNKAALNCQRALMSVQGTIHQLSESRKNVKALEHVPS